MPDDARHVEVRALLLDDRSEGHVAEPGFALLQPALGIAVVHGSLSEPAARDVRAWSQRASIVATERDALVRILSEDVVEYAIAHALPTTAPVDGSPRRAGVRWLDEVDLAHVPIEWREEHLLALSHGPIAASVAGGAPVAFAYAVLRTERWFSLSVGTVAAYRRQGHGRAAVAALIERERADGREPSWGSLATNLASIRLARALGFEECGPIWVVEPR